MQGLVFLAATNIEKVNPFLNLRILNLFKSLNVINGGGKGGKIGDMIKINATAQNLKNNDFYLDNVTGDMYSYHALKAEWIPKMNAGMHNAKAAQNYDSLGKVII